MAFLRNIFRRDQSAAHGPIPRRESFVLEPLESRLLLSADLLGVPNFVEQGPGVTIDGQTAGLAGPNPVTGAMEAIAAHPTDANTIFVGTVAGGIWRTTDGGTNWTPLTDQWPSLAIGAIAYSPLDGTNNTLFAGTGGFSSGGNDGPAVGALRTTDAGNSWVPIGSEFTGERVRSIVPTSLGTSLADQVVLAATIDFGGGVYRSTDGGSTFTLVSGTSGASDGLDNDADGSADELGEVNLPFGNASHLVPDPGNANRFYTALPGQGVFRSDNGGANWVQVTNGLTGVGGTSRIELSVSAAAGNPVYAALISPSAVRHQLTGVFRSADQGNNWTQIGTAPAIHPGQQADIHFAILADNTADNIVFVGGDRQASSPFVGNLFRGDSEEDAWVPLVLRFANGTAPHADSRDMVFAANNTILQVDDAGIYRLVNPNGPGTTAVWQSLPSMPRVAQFTNIAYDQLNGTILGGTQDTGTPEQVLFRTWRDVSLGDGGVAAVDNDENAHPGTTIHYSSNQFLDFFTRRTLDDSNTETDRTPVGLVVSGAGGKTLLSGAANGMSTFDRTIQFTQPFVLNSVTPARMLIGTSFLYESTNNGDTLTSLGGLNNLNANGLDDDGDGATDEGDEFTAAGAIGPVGAMVYGGRSDGADNADLIYVGSGATLRLRTANTTNTLADFTTVAAYPGGTIRDIEVDPDDWRRGYIVDATGRVFRFENSGATAADWTNITGVAGQGSLNDLVRDLRDVELFTPKTTTGDDSVLVSGLGGVYRTLNPGPNSVWTEFGRNLPNAIATDLLYDAVDDVLVVGTYGRGAWTLANASTAIATPAVLQVSGDTDFAGQDDSIRLVRQANNPTLLDVFLNSATPSLTVPLSALQQIIVDGFDGNDTLVVDSSNGLINVPLGIRYDGGSGVDQLQLLQTGGPTRISDTYSIGPTIGSGVSTIVGSGNAGTQTIFFENISPVLDLVSSALLTINATAADNAINYSVGSSFANGLVTIDEHEPIEFSNKTSLTINAGAGQDTINLNNPNTPTGLTGGITINGGDPSGGDTLSVMGVGGAVAVDTAAGTIDGATGAAGDVSISFSSTETLNLLAGIGDLTLATTAADDTVTVTPGLTTGSNSGSVRSSGAGPQIDFANSGALTARLRGGSDTMVVVGSSSADTIRVSGAAVAIAGRHKVCFAGVQALTVEGRAGDDTFRVTPSLGVPIFIDGGDPIGGTRGDRLNIIADSARVTQNSGPENDEGSFVVGSRRPVSFDHIESFRVIRTEPAGQVPSV